ncbi:hypothetical protein [Orlajensenia leifsoniae]|uniref:Glycosyltransferase family 1 protein n=1 Tax=Orlajensenia leifsoniae TaxID=2561933 RepID=A0A4Y9QXV8_9MICO|nr:hypothetical protein [Leifsonia flava]TFV96957.1 hypothetical protein E4M00_12940 [Leifsonia flava]
MTVERIRVLIVYPFAPHYRRGIFDALQADERLDVEFASDPIGRGGIAVIPSAEFGIHHAAPVRSIGSLKWQSRVLGLVGRRRYDAVVFLGDASYVTTWLSACVARARSQAVLFWTIGWHRPERGLKRALRLIFYRFANVLLLYGEMARSIGINMGYPPPTDGRHWE